MVLKKFTFNPFSENTYVLSDATKECIIIDPGCYHPGEKEELSQYILAAGLNPVAIVLTHAHIDHILGNNYLAGKYGIPIIMSELEVELMKSAAVYGEMWGIKVEPSPNPSGFLEEGKSYRFGTTELEVFFTPGHSPGSYSLYHRSSKQSKYLSKQRRLLQ